MLKKRLARGEPGFRLFSGQTEQPSTKHIMSVYEVVGALMMIFGLSMTLANPAKEADTFVICLLLFVTGLTFCAYGWRSRKHR
jgi:hypothetical protein